MGRAPCCEKIGLKQGKWTKEEDEILANYIKAHGEGSWRSLPKNAGLLRCGKSCRLRWINYLRAGLKRGSFSSEEDELIIKLHAALGNRWSLISNELPGRTDNDIKNYWNSHLRRCTRSYHVTRDGNTEAESVKPHKNSQKNNSKKIRKKRKVVNKVIHPQASYKHCNETIQSESSSLTDEVLWDSNDDAFNNPEYWTFESMKSPSEYSCTTDEPSTSKEEIRTEPSSPDFNSILKEIDNLLNGEIEEMNAENGSHNNINMPGDIQNGCVVQKELEAGTEVEDFFEDLCCIDFSFDMNLWSSTEDVFSHHTISGHCIPDAFEFPSIF